ncbi:hypothetical protein Aduo_014059 [Ancylostoma duodenale]
MTRLFFLLSGCIAFVDSLNNFLVQGRADTLKVLRKIVRDRDAKVVPFDPYASGNVAWQATTPKDLHSREFQKAMEGQQSIKVASSRGAESGHCKPIDLIDCSVFDSDEITYKDLVDLLASIRDADSGRERSVLVKDLANELAKNIIVTVIFTILIMVAIFEIFVGAINWDDCPVKDWIPMWLVISGSTNCLRYIVAIALALKIHAMFLRWLDTVEIL